MDPFTSILLETVASHPEKLDPIAKWMVKNKVYHLEIGEFEIHLGKANWENEIKKKEPTKGKYK